MPIGPGKYDEVCTMVREKHNAKLAIVIIIGGDEGEGFSMQIDSRFATWPNIEKGISVVLRDVADQIDESLKQN